MFDLNSMAVQKRQKRKPNLRKEAQQRLEFLCLRHAVDVKLKWSWGRRKGIYSNHTKTITLGPKAWNGVESTLLHCFAHAILAQNCISLRPHNTKFKECLWRLVLEHYRNPTLYNWYGELGGIYQWGMIRCKGWQMQREEGFED